MDLDMDIVQTVFFVHAKFEHDTITEKTLK